MSKKDKDVKIVSKRSYKYWGLAEMLITSIIPITYIFLNYELYKKGGGKLTYWVWIIIVFALNFLKKFITKFILDLRKEQSDFAKRGTRIIVLTIISLLLIFSYIWIKDLIILLLVYTGSLLISMYPYYFYTKNKAYYEYVKEINKEETTKRNLNDGKLIVK